MQKLTHGQAEQKAADLLKSAIEDAWNRGAAHGWKERDALKAQLAERQKFKDWVHAYLDAHGVPNHPPGTHGEHGCRIGDRMDWLMAKLATMLEVCNEAYEWLQGDSGMGSHQKKLVQKLADAISDAKGAEGTVRILRCYKKSGLHFS